MARILTLDIPFHLARMADTGRNGRKVANNTYLSVNGSEVSLRLHSTDIVVWPNYPVSPEMVTLDNGGWQSVTTKARLNAIPGVFIYQKNHAWFIKTLRGVFAFENKASLNIKTGRYSLYGKTLAPVKS